MIRRFRLNTDSDIDHYSTYMNNALFIDKDGTLVDDVPDNVLSELFTFRQGAIPVIREARARGMLCIVVTNQSGIAMGHFTEGDLRRLFIDLNQTLTKEGAAIDAFYYCPHHPQGNLSKFRMNCLGRKPGPGMLIAAAKDFDIDLRHSWMIGDILHDVEAGKRAGCKSILLDDRHEQQWFRNTSERRPDYIISSWEEAGKLLFGEQSFTYE